jgi:hypothetical protein
MDSTMEKFTKKSIGKSKARTVGQTLKNKKG